MKNKSKFSMLKALFKMMDKSLKLKMPIAVFFGVISQCLFLVTIGLPVMYIGFLIEGLLNGISNPLSLTLVISISVCSGLLRGFTKFGEQYMNHFIAFHLLANIRSHVYNALERLTPNKNQEKKQGELIELITADTETIEVFYAHTISPVCITITSGIISFIIVGVFASWIIAGVFILLYILLGTLVPYIEYKLQKESGTEYREDYSMLTSSYMDLLNGINEIRYMNGIDQSLNKITQESNKLGNSYIRAKNLGTVCAAFNDLIIMAFSLIIVVVSLFLNNLDLRKAIFGALFAISSFAPSLALAALPTNLVQTFKSAERIIDLIEEKPSINNIEGGEINVDFSKINLNNVSFSYTKDKSIFKDVSLTLPSKGIIGIQGPSGIGKSTLLKLIFRHVKPISGSINYSGLDVENINSEYLRKNIALMGQSTYLFNETIRENMLEADPLASDEQIYEALRKVKMEDFVKSLPEKLDYEISSDNTNISLGQKQRLGLARILLRNPKILLLDEPTSNIDWLNEHFIFNTIKEFSKEHLVVLVAHENSAISNADHIYSVENNVLKFVN